MDRTDPLGTLYEVTGSEKSKMAAYKTAYWIFAILFRDCLRSREIITLWLRVQLFVFRSCFRSSVASTYEHHVFIRMQSVTDRSFWFRSFPRYIALPNDCIVCRHGTNWRHRFLQCECSQYCLTPSESRVHCSWFYCTDGFWNRETRWCADDHKTVRMISPRMSTMSLDVSSICSIHSWSVWNPYVIVRNRLSTILFMSVVCRSAHGMRPCWYMANTRWLSLLIFGVVSWLQINIDEPLFALAHQIKQNK